MNEGAIPFLLSNLFDYMVVNRIVKSNTDILNRIRDFNFGELRKQNKPTDISLAGKGLGQNASQLHCLFIHLPFIFADEREELESIWIVVESLLRCIEIIYSKVITEEDLEELALLTGIHLDNFIRIFNEYLRPKHHLMTHYPNAIRRMGPLIYFWMMRFESMHQVFTRLVKHTNNYVNITKTLAQKHQAMIAYKRFQLNGVQTSMSKKFINTDTFPKYKDQVTNCTGGEIDVRDFFVLKFAIFNSFEYREGLMIIIEKKMCEIVHVFSVHGEILLFCKPYRVVKFESFFNSIEITTDIHSIFTLVNLKSISNMKTYERKFVQNKMYVICDTLAVRKILLTH